MSEQTAREWPCGYHEKQVKWCKRCERIAAFAASAVAAATQQLQAENDTAQRIIEGWKDAATTLGLVPDALNVWRNGPADAAEAQVRELTEALRKSRCVLGSALCQLEKAGVEFVPLTDAALARKETPTK